MKKYIILVGSVDGATCEDDGFVNCANFDLASPKACKNVEDANKLRDQIMEDDLVEYADIWPEEDGYILDNGDLGNDKFIDIYYKGELVNETIYKIREIEC